MRLILLAMLGGASAALAASPQEDLATVRQRLVQAVLQRDERTPEQIVGEARDAADRLAADGTWPDIDYSDASRHDWKSRHHMERVRTMARACRIARETGKRDERLTQAVWRALDEWLRRDPQNPNWWHNEIGVPLMAGGTAILMADDLSPQQIEGIGRIMRRGAWTKWTGQNLVWGASIQIMRGVIENDADAVGEAYARLYDEIRISTREGIQPDFSFHQHGAQFYTGGYGLGFAEDVPRYVSLAWGTRWQISDPPMQVLTSYLLDGLQWTMYRDRMDHSAVGREIVRRGRRATGRPDGAANELQQSLSMMSAHPIPRQAEIMRSVARLRGEDDGSFIGNRHFWRSDYMVHRGRGWMASVRMFSRRTINAELVNSEGKRSHHLADGANFIYVTGNEYLDIFPCWDWAKVPGTTAQQESLHIDGETRSIGIRGKTNFVGGVSDGDAGVAAMDLSRGTLLAKKFWFFFGDGYVCLGTGITSSGEHPIATSVNQCLLDGRVSEGANWVHHGRAGYVFADRANVKMTSATQEGRWSDIGEDSDALVRKDVFNLWIDHGTRPKDAGYEYVIWPNLTAEQTEAAAKDSRILLFSNHDRIQAAFDREQVLVGIAFWEPGRLTFADHSVQVDQPCLVLLDRGRKPMRVAVANPKNEALTVNMEIDRKPIRIDLPGGEMAGSSVVRELP